MTNTMYPTAYTRKLSKRACTTGLVAWTTFIPSFQILVQITLCIELTYRKKFSFKERQIFIFNSDLINGRYSLVLTRSWLIRLSVCFEALIIFRLYKLFPSLYYFWLFSFKFTIIGSTIFDLPTRPNRAFFVCSLILIF